MTEPTFDADGYPTDDTVKALEMWPYQDIVGALEFMAAAWRWPDFGVSRALRPEEAHVVRAEAGDTFLRLATGGWSGNEELIAAFRTNRVCYALAWRLHARGGLHIFQYPTNPEPCDDSHG